MSQHYMVRRIDRLEKKVDFLMDDRRKWFNLCKSLAALVVENIEPAKIVEAAKRRDSVPQIDGYIIRCYQIGGFQVAMKYWAEVPIDDIESSNEAGIAFVYGLRTKVINGRLECP